MPSLSYSRAAVLLIQAAPSLVCPAVSSGHTYWAILRDGGASTLYAYTYTDATYDSTVNSLAYSGLFTLTNFDGWVVGDLVVFNAGATSGGLVRQYVVTWNPTTGSHWIADTGLDGPLDVKPISATEGILIFENGDIELEVYRFPLATTIAAVDWPTYLDETIPNPSFDYSFGTPFLNTTAAQGFAPGFDFSQSFPDDGRLFAIGGGSDVAPVHEFHAGGFIGGRKIGSLGALVHSQYEADGTAIDSIGVVSTAGGYTRWTPAAWTIGDAQVAPSPDGSEFSAVIQPTPGTPLLFRATAGVIDDSCSLVTAAVGAAPQGTPFHLFPRD